MRKSSGLLSLIIVVMLMLFFMAGCATPIKEWEHKNNRHTDLEFTANGEFLGYVLDLPKKAQTSNGTTANLTEGFDFAPRIGLRATSGNDKFRFGGGLDARTSVAAFGDKDSTLSKKKREPTSGEQYSFTRLEPSFITTIPYLTVGWRPAESIQLDLEVGMPITGFTLKSGRDSYNKWRASQKHEWWGVGQRYVGRFSYLFDPDGFEAVSVGFVYERYDAEFGGEKAEINALGGYVEFKWKF